MPDDILLHDEVESRAVGNPMEDFGLKKFRKLIQRTYLGVGYVHQFVNDSTSEIVVVPCTEMEYTRLSEVGGSQFNPVLEGHTWIGSGGGTDKVDTSSTLLGEDEYCIKNDKTLVVLSGISGPERYKELALSAVDANDNFDESNI